VLFLLLAVDGRLSGPFPFSAGIGDIITGVLAVALALNALHSQRLPTAAFASWNAFGAIDLFAAVGLGLTTANGSPLQLIHLGSGRRRCSSCPFAWRPRSWRRST
jgi:hypothetical protein